MNFKFYNYIYPTWFFQLKPKKSIAIFPDYSSLPDEYQDIISVDDGFKTVEAMWSDAAFQACQKGVILPDVKPIPEYKIDVSDEYRFIKKYFNPVWSFYILIVRLISLKNPLVEIPGFINSLKVKRNKIFQNVATHCGFKSSRSHLIENKEKVSVIIPTLNRYTYLKDVLSDLSQQTFTNFDVIVVDQSDQFDKEFYLNFSELDIKLIHQKEKALWLARNTAIEASDADLFLLFDDDSRVDPDWIEQHLKCIDYFNADISSGVSISKSGDKVPENYSFFRWSDQLDTGNVLIKREVFQSLGLFDRMFEKQRMGDAEFGLRAHIHGFKNISNPLAQRLHLKVGTGGLRQMGSWDGYRPKKFWKPRPIPSILYLFRKYYGNRSAKLALLKNVPLSIIPYRFKGNKKLAMISFVFILPLLPLLLIQIYRSWNISSRMLKEGPKIKEFI
ncbi:glycosyltransferase family 2 protein [bacterium]|nr:glycosyltransferase family 2 protein [bacterium]